VGSDVLLELEMAPRAGFVWAVQITVQISIQVELFGCRQHQSAAADVDVVVAAVALRVVEALLAPR
jgi:hypothetical protein